MIRPKQENTTLRYLALGDSYTIGESVPAAGRWPQQLAAALGEEGIVLGEVKIVARTGWTTSELLFAMDKQVLQGPYQLVTLLVGVNNQYRGLPLQEYRQELAVLMRRAVELSGGRPEHVLVVTIPDWGVMPFAAGRDRQKISREIDQFNAALREQAHQAGLALVDITSISRQADANLDYIASDGLHPSAGQYAAWVRLILPEALQFFE